MGSVTAPTPAARQAAPETATAVERSNQQVHLNIPTLLWRAVAGIAEATGTSMTNVVVRALTREAFFTRELLEDPGTRIWVEHTNGERKEVVFL
jgi:hypothetical protein